MWKVLYVERILKKIHRIRYKLKMTITNSWRRKTSLPRIEDGFRDLLGLNFIGENIKNTVKVQQMLHSGKWRCYSFIVFICLEWSETVFFLSSPLASAWLGTHL